MSCPEGYRRLTLKDLAIAPDGRSARYGFLQFRLAQVGEHECEWRWITDVGSSYSSPPLRRIEDAAEHLIKHVQDLNVTVAIDG